MKKSLSLLLLILVLVLSVALFGCSSQNEPADTDPGENNEENNEEQQPTGDVITLRYADTVNDTDVDGLGAKYWADLVAERTNGQVNIEFYGSSQLGSDKTITQATIAGTIDVAKCSTGNFAEFSDALAFTELPGLFTDLDHLTKVFASDLRQELIDEIYEETGLYVMMFDADGGEPRCLCSNVEVHLPTDMTNVKVRTTGAAVEVALFQSWGAGPTTVEWSELYSAMQQNMADAFYTQPAYVVYNNLYEVADYLILCNQSWAPSVKVMGSAAIEKLGGVDSELFQTVLECAVEAEQYKLTLWEDELARVWSTLEDSGITIVELSDEERAVWDEYSASIWDQFIGDSISQELIDRIQALAE